MTSLLLPTGLDHTNPSHRQLEASYFQELSLRGIGLYAQFLKKAPTIFWKDAQDLDDGVYLTQRSWLSVKAELAFHAVSQDPYYMPGGSYIAGWSAPATCFSWGSDHQPQTPGQLDLISHLFYDCVGTIHPPPWDSVYDPYTKSTLYSVPTRFPPILPATFRPQGMTLAPPARFDVESLGRDALSRFSCGGTLKTREILHFASQEDFEFLQGAPRLAARGVFASDGGFDFRMRRDLSNADPLRDGTPATDSSGAARNYPRVVSLPRFDRRSITASSSGPPYYGFSRLYGALGLASQEAGFLGGSALSPKAETLWSMSNDFDWQITPPNREYRSEVDPVFAAASGAVRTPLQVGSLGLPFCLSLVDYLFHWPYCVTGSSDPFRCPGAAPPSSIQQMSFEAWMGPSSWITLNHTPSLPPGPVPALNVISLEADRNNDFTNYFSTHFTLTVITGPISVSLEGDVEDAEVPSRDYHVVVTVQESAGRSHIKAYVNGLPLDSLGTNEIDHIPLNVDSPLILSVNSADEVRIYEEALSPGQVERLYNNRLDRYVRSGAYTSPLYTLDEPGRLDQVQWTALTPPRFAPPGSFVFPTNQMTVRIERRDDLGQVMPTPTLPDVGGIPQAIAAAPKPVRSFRYFVDFNCSSIPVTEPLVDTPIFESIWFSLRRPGRTGWLSWR